MVMALVVFHHHSTKLLMIAAGYESGHVILHQYEPKQGWTSQYLAQIHKQPGMFIFVKDHGYSTLHWTCE
jgi:hypothetical protein